MKIRNKRQLHQIASNHSSDIRFKDFLKLSKHYTKQSFSFLVNDTTLHQENHYDLGRTYHSVTITETTRTTNKK